MKSQMFETKFLVMHTDNQLNWKCYIDLILPKLSTAGFIIRRLFHVLNPEILQMVYYAFFHSVIRYGTVFYGNSSNICKDFKLQKKVIKIMPGVQSRVSCRGFFRKLDILPISYQYILSLMFFIIDNPNSFQSGSEVHGLNTRCRNHLYIPTVNL